MALSPVDFAAYSRATGAPYPESPEEKARMVPEVRAFRAGQLQQGESGGENHMAGAGLWSIYRKAILGKTTLCFSQSMDSRLS